jgi:RES domain-containing protein
MLVYRLAKDQFAQDLSGEGAKRYGGRWNSIGIPVLYTSSTIALALVEMLVHLPKKNLPNDLVLITIEIEKSATLDILNPIDLPKEWIQFPIPKETQNIGDEWLASNSNLSLQIPSVIIPEEKNILINVNHPNFNAQVKIKNSRKFSFDNRLI